jgi:hypothetical protein
MYVVTTVGLWSGYRNHRRQGTGLERRVAVGWEGVVCCSWEALGIPWTVIPYQFLTCLICV